MFFRLPLVLVVATSLFLAGLVIPSDSADSQATRPHRVYLPAAFPRQAERPAILGLWHRNFTDSRFLQRTVESTASTVRYGLQWDAIEPVEATPPQYRWEFFDAELRLLTRNGIAPMVNIVDPPDWAAFPVCGPFKEGKLDRFLAFARAATERYGGPPFYVRDWQIFNEPDRILTDPNARWGGAGGGIGCWGQDPAGYGALLNAVSKTIKTVDPQARVVFGALTADNCQWAINCDFLRQVLDPRIGNAGDAFDVVSFNHYPWFRAKWERFGTSLLGKAEGHRILMLAFGLTKPIYVAEAGLRVATSDGMHGGSNDDLTRFVPQELTHALVDAARPGIDRIERVFWFSLTDNEDGQWGMVAPDGTPRPAFVAYQIWSRRLADARFVANLSERTSERMPGALPDPPSRQRCLERAETCPKDETGGLLYFDAIQHYQFRAPAGDLHVLWIDPGYQLLSTTATREIRFPVSRFVDARDYLDQPVIPQRVGDEVVLTISQRPVYVALR